MSIFVEVSNLGPLRSAEAEMADLTLLIGENNTGKTFFATVLHRVLAASRADPPHLPGLGRECPDEVREWFESRMAALPDDSPRVTDPEAKPPGAVLRWATGIITARLEAFGMEVREGVEYAYGVEASQLRRRTASRRASGCYVRIRNTDPDWQAEVRFDSDEVRVTPPDPMTWLQRLVDDERAQRESEEDKRTRGTLARRSRLRGLFSGYNVGGPIPDGLFGSWPRSSVHLPANRTGIMQSYQVIAGSVVRQSAAAGIRPIEIDPLPGTSADFLALLLTDSEDPFWYERVNPRYRSLIEDLEKDLGAEIALEERPNSAAAVTVITPEGTFPLSRASSMLSELAPVLLVLKGATRWADNLTIDEPEAHLHPAMQRRLASFIAEVVARGTRVVLTTHSDFFLGEINNLIRSRKLVDSQAPRRRNGRSASEKPTVCALRFSREQRWCVGRPLVLDPVDGIDESTFTDVMESLYDDSVQLINELL